MLQLMELAEIRLLSVLADVFFFFQAEDGIRDYKVTGVQTCALPIYEGRGRLHPQPDVDAELAHLAREEADDPRVLRASRRARGEEYLSAQLGRFLYQIGRASCRERV